MYNLTVDTAHTFFVGAGDWLVHNACPPLLSEVRALRDAGLTREQRRLIYEKSAGVRNIDEISPLAGNDNIMLSPFSSSAVQLPRTGRPLFPLTPAQSFDMLEQQAQRLNTRLLSDPEYADLQNVIPELEASDAIIFNLKTNLTQSNWLTTQELNYVLSNEEILGKTQFLV